MSSLITVEVALPSRSLWTALRYADRWLVERLEPDEDRFFITATGSELRHDDQLRAHFVHLATSTPGLSERLRQRLSGRPLGAFDVLQILFVHVDRAPPGPCDPADAPMIEALLGGGDLPPSAVSRPAARRSR